MGIALSVDPGTDSLGMPTDDGSSAAPSNVDMTDPDTTTTPGFLSSLESFASSAATAGENAVKTVYTGVKTVAGDTISGAEGAVKSGVGAVTGAATSFTVDIVLVLAVVGIALVLIAKSGAVKASL